MSLKNLLKKVLANLKKRIEVRQAQKQHEVRKQNNREQIKLILRDLQ